MPIYHQGRKVKEVYHQGRKVKEIWHMGRKIYSSKPVEVMPFTAGMYDARDWLRATVRKYGQDYTTVTELPFEIDSRNATQVYGMFYQCSSLTKVPDMDTSNVTDMSNMFAYCNSLTTVPKMDTSKVVNMYAMFQNCRSLTNVPEMVTGNVQSMSYMLNGCSSLTDGSVRLIGKHPQVKTSGMISRSGLTREPFYNPDGTPIN